MTKAGYASLVAARAARAEVVATVRAGGAVSAAKLRGYGISKTKTGAYRYYDPAVKGYVTTKPAAQIAAEKAAEVEVAKPRAEYFYQPKTGRMSYRVAGEKPRGEGWVSMGTEKPTAYAIRQARGISEIPHRIVEVREPVPRVEPRVGIEPRAEVPTLATAISFGRPPPTKYEPTPIGGLKLAWAKGREIVAGVREKYIAYTPPGLVPVTRKAIDISKQLEKALKVKKVKEVVVKVKEKVRVIPKGIAWVKEEFVPEIKTEAQMLKGVREWKKDMEKIERTFMKARAGYVWAEAKAREWKPEPIVKQPVFLKGVDPYKAFREQTKKQAVGMAQAGKVTMGAMVGITEEVKVKPYKLPLIYAAGAVVGPAAAKILGVGKVAKVAAVGVGAALVTGVGVEVAMIPPGIEREKAVGVRAAELAAFIGGAKYGIEKKPVTKLYKAVVEKPYIKYVKEPRFERAMDKWMKSLEAKKWTYLEKRAFIPIKKIPQRTLFGEPITPKKIKLLRAEVHPDILRYELPKEIPKELLRYEKFIQKPLRDIYVRKAIDLAYPKVITVTPKKMITMKYRQMLGAEPGRFIFEKPKLRIIPDITKIDKSIQTMLAPKLRRVTKIDRPFYITKPKLPKPVILGKPKKITPVHLKPEPRLKPIEVMPGVSVRPVYAVEPRPPADISEVIGTIPRGRELAGALVLGGLRVGAEDLTGRLSRQFGAARQRAEQRQAARLAVGLAQQAIQAAKQRAKQAAKQAAKQIPKVKPVVKVVPKLEPVVKVVPKLKVPTKQVPITKDITVPYFRFDTYIPPPPEPEKPPPPPPLLMIPKFKWPRGRILLAPRKKKKIKPFHKYMPSLIAGMEKITAYKVPKRITGLGIRPVVIKRF